MGDEHAPDGFCCGTCELAERTAQGKVSFEPSAHLIVGGSHVVVVVHELQSGGPIVRRISLRRGQRLVVGRAAGNDIVIQSAFADRRIFALEVTDTGAVFVEDVGSNCGTLVNGRRVARQQLHLRDVINAAGNTYLTFQQGAECGTPTRFERSYRAS